MDFRDLVHGLFIESIYRKKQQDNIDWIFFAVNDTLFL